jgi:hypothetical protein
MMQVSGEFELQNQAVDRLSVVKQCDTAIELRRMTLAGTAELTGIMQR